MGLWSGRRYRLAARGRGRWPLPILRSEEEYGCATTAERIEGLASSQGLTKFPATVSVWIGYLF